MKRCAYNSAGLNLVASFPFLVASPLILHLAHAFKYHGIALLKLHNTDLQLSMSNVIFTQEV